METGGAVVVLDETSIVHVRPGAAPPDLVALTPDDPAAAVAAVLAAVPPAPSVLLVGCGKDLDTTTAGLATAYATVVRDDGYAILSRR
jgi:hypothetical protein